MEMKFLSRGFAHAAIVPYLRALCLAATTDPVHAACAPTRRAPVMSVFGPIAFATQSPIVFAGLGRMQSSFQRKSTRVQATRMSTGWSGGTAASRGSRGARRSWDTAKQGEEKSGENRFWGSESQFQGDGSSRIDRSGSDFEAGRDRRRGQGAFRGRGRDFGRGRPGQVAEETREELWERRREQQAVQAERQSWLQVQNERFPDSQYLFGVSPVLAALRTKRRILHVLYIQDTMDLLKRKDKDAIAEVERLAEEAGCEVVRTDKGRLNVMSDNRLHQVPSDQRAARRQGSQHEPAIARPHARTPARRRARVRPGRPQRTRRPALFPTPPSPHPSRRPARPARQGLVLQCGPLDFVPIGSMEDVAPAAKIAGGGRPPVWLVLDEVSGL